ncbi:AAA family ATPase [Nostoc sp. FACHB-280]|uniref:ATP-binding protein n=1 Tax=Nostoc sp. FACHB-280 TaxID=2692839 RepID=UPI00168A54AA|nr:serine/threonine-protein kinase PknK [Nostoc sp. FACHB-280]MBD2495859.1 serine/threonine-protein kinase PknK [Nostoc sp. FACHB-280]
MVANLSGYLLNEYLYESVDTSIYRCRRQSDFSTVIIKTTRAKHPKPEEITKLRHEYTILQALSDVKGVIKAHSLEKYGHSSALILEDVWGIPFNQLLALGKLPVLTVLAVAIQLAQSLHSIHTKQIIHRDINPHNILLIPESLTVKLIDFSMAVQLSTETPCIYRPKNLVEHLANISPEKNATTNLSLDYRTDFYGLGVTCYEMLTGKLPFTTSDALDLSQCQIAKTPLPPHIIDSEIPEAVSDIVMKLMAINPKDRYQNALGLKADLETCLYQLQCQGEITEFDLGELDQFACFQIPQRLYGRIQEIRLLLDGFYRVATGSTEMILVSGDLGSGKTSVVNEIAQFIEQQQGYFIAGQFDQSKQHIPYSAFIEALQGLIEQILTESAEKIACCKYNLIKALGVNIQVIIDLIPGIAQIIGNVSQLGDRSPQNCLHQVLQQVLEVFTKAEHPLVLFLDNLQWADAASLQLIETIICNQYSQRLLLIGAYRDSEVYPHHPLIQTVEKIHFCKPVVQNIGLQPLDIEDICELISDSLNATLTLHSFPLHHKNHARVRDLAQLIYHKTQGNPLLINQILHKIEKSNLLRFDFIHRQWQWKLEEIQAISITDERVLEAAIQTLPQLSDITLQALKLGACLGNQFTLNNLAIAQKISPQATLDILSEALQLNLIFPLLGTDKITYKFLGDRLQKTVYSLIPNDHKQKTHLNIGRLLLQKIPETALTENIFDIVTQLNLAWELITQTSDKEHLAVLNLIAGTEAKKSTDYATAVKYFNFGLGLLPKTAWSTNYDLALNLHLELIEAEYLAANYYQVQQLSAIVVSKAKKPLDKIKVFEIQIQYYLNQNQIQAAIDSAASALKMLGIASPKETAQQNILGKSLITKILLKIKGIDNLPQLPEMTDPYKIAAIKILTSILVPSYFTAPHLFSFVIFKIVNLSVRFGNSPQAAYGYALYSWLLCGVLGDIKTGYEFGQLAMKLMARFDNPEIKCKVVNIFNADVRHWQEHAQATIPAFVEALDMSLAVNNLENAAKSSINYCYYQFLLGEHLDNVRHAQTTYINLMRQLKQENAVQAISIVRQTAANLAGASAYTYCLIGDEFNEVEMLPILQSDNHYAELFMAYSCKAMLLYFFKEYDLSVENAELAENYAASSLGTMALAVHNFYYSLALLGSYGNQQHLDAQKQILHKIENNQNKMRNWATHAPANYQHKYELIAAEKARVLGNNLKAIARYKAASQGAAQSGYIQEEALANELIAEFYFAYNQVTVAEIYLTKSYYGYIHWGATAKVKNLEAKYPGFFARILQRQNTNLDVAVLNYS